mmetsp:Transcript_22631/g.25481  ORF Transcript_22631/g.25481 Transcript_22631/m.25481 type:complete len:82 (-) Transcript_22631:1071-1316(-)
MKPQILRIHKKKKTKGKNGSHLQLQFIISRNSSMVTFLSTSTDSTTSCITAVLTETSSSAFRDLRILCRLSPYFRNILLIL